MATGTQNKIYQNLSWRPLQWRDCLQFNRGNVSPFQHIGGETNTAAVIGPNKTPGGSPDVPFVIGVFSAMDEAAQPGNIRAIDSELVFNYPGSTAIEVNPTGIDGQPVSGSNNTSPSNVAAIRGGVTIAGTYTGSAAGTGMAGVDPSKTVATTITAGYIYGVQGKINLGGIVAVGSGFVAALFGQLDTSVATAAVTNGYVSALHLDMGATSSLSSGSEVYVNAQTITNTCATLKMNSVLKVIANAAYFMDVAESNLTGNWIVASSGVTTQNKSLKVLVDGVVYYIPLCTSTT